MDHVQTCPACGGSAGLAGILASLAHLCCRHCGLWWNADTADLDLEQPEDQPA